MIGTKNISLAIATGIVAAVAFTATAFADTTRTFQTSLSGANETPAITSQTTGSMTLSFIMGTGAIGGTTNGSNMQYTLNAVGSDITMAHLHCGPSGVNGPSVVTLFTHPQSATSTATSTMAGVNINGVLSSGSISNSNIMSADCQSRIGYNINNVTDLANALMSGNIYANIHTVQYVGGAARGQLTEINAPTATSTPTTTTPTTSVSDAKTALLISLYQQLITVLTQWLVLIQQQKGLVQ